ncbi:MAG: metallophosphoesterase [Acetobacter sp.]|nr:metallophosphoesterase [Acetobacter sp.]
MKRAKNIIDIDLSVKDAKILVASDVHIPFQDDKAVDAFLNACDDLNPDIVVLNGDVMDMFMLSKFTKGEGRNPLEEVMMCREFLQRVRNAAPNAQIFYVIGNHETRLERYVLTKAPELASLIEDVFSILKVSDFNIRGCASVTINDTLVFKHGTLLGNKSGLSAIKEMENAYMSGCTGHTHRLCKYIARKAGRKFFWIETGCLCDMNPEYMVLPNWQQGFAELFIKNGKVVRAQVAEIENGEIV